MPDDLYQRYMDALTAYRDHRTACTDPQCNDSGRCPDGERLWTEFTRGQDAHMERVRKRCP